ncbi:ABC transporter permease subunit [Natronomonas salina]|uniref:PhnE/PtxC family ABC transporter permease n=1 Tax=Natronomonas salina TaxID=1710540 RepID=UPI0015B6DFA1|nr:ABC transporter permease subunit [Natronomonas salina]QLD88967.1 ABC transporter permease subunit [Natronomonas salina]
MSDDPTPDGTTTDVDREPLAGRLDRIQRTRRRRAVGYLVLIAAIGLLFVQALAAAGILDTEYNAAFFLESLRDFVPLTLYFGVVPFVDFGQYLAFIGERNLLFASDVTLLWRDPATLVGEVSTIVAEDGIFSVFGVAGITLAMGFAGTIIGFPLALLFGVLGSERVLPFPLNFLFRGTMSAIRAIPALVWILIYIPLAGLTPVSAVFAIATDTVGNLGRLFTDELEEIEDGPIEAMETTGANRSQLVTFGMLSQVTTPYIAWTLYIFEINVRIAVSLGVLGGGGLGQVVETQVNLLQFSNAMATLLCIFLLIISVELFSQRIRARLRSDTEPMGLKELILGFPRRFAESLTR